MPADILEFADAIVALVQGEFDSAGATATVDRDYLNDVELDTVNGLYARVLPVGYLKDSPAERESDYFDAGVAIVVSEVYRGDEPRPPKEWVDERVNLVERCVFDPLRKIGTDADVPLLLDEWFNQWADVTMAYDEKLLRENGVFSSEIEVIFRKLRVSVG
jgi:hypothetical protein